MASTARRTTHHHQLIMRFDYQTVMFDTRDWLGSGTLDGQAFTDRLNALGDEGWELVSVFDTNRREGVTDTVVAVFKRPRAR